jgi:hypothetical protein
VTVFASTDGDADNVIAINTTTSARVRLTMAVNETTSGQ